VKTEQLFQIYYVMLSLTNLLLKNVKVVLCSIMLEIRKDLCRSLKCKQVVWITTTVV